MLPVGKHNIHHKPKKMSRGAGDLLEERVQLMPMRQPGMHVPHARHAGPTPVTPWGRRKMAVAVPG
jgi:hypothetical protein